MSWISNISNRLFKLTGTDTQLFAPEFWQQGISSYAFSGYSMSEFICNAYSNPYVFMCVDKIADIIAQLPYKILDTNTGEEASPALSSEILSILNRPNSDQTADDFYYEIVNQLLVTGNCFIKGSRPIGFSQIGALEVLNTQFVEINTVKGLDSGEVISYSYSDCGVYEVIPKEDILHIKFPNIVAQTNWGLSPLYAAIQVYESSNNIFEAEASLHKNRGISGILSNADSNMPLMPKEQQRLQKDWDSRTAGAHNFGGVYVTNAAMKWLSIGMSPEDLKSLEGNLNKLRIICSIYGLDSSLFNDPANKTFNNRLEAEKSMYTSVVIPLADKINRSLSQWLGFDNLGIKADTSKVSVLARPDFEKSKKVVEEVKAGILPKTEALKILYPEIEIQEETTIEDEPEEAVDANALAQANLRGSVGGVQGILQLQQSFNSGITSESSAINILIEIYGFEQATARQILGV